MKFATNTPLDKLLNGGVECDAITNIYGPAGSGKTNIALSAALKCAAENRKAIYIDTEGSFSLERFRQLGGSEKTLKNIIMLEPHTWKEQHENVLGLEKIIGEENVSLVVVDSLVALYRLELDHENFALINKQLATQYSVLSSITRKHKMPVIVTNQVYSLGEQIELTSRTIAKYWSKALIELRKLERPNHRVAIVPKGKT